MIFYLLDVFAEEPYSGNQLAVFLGSPPSDLMQKLAREMNLSETTFITSPEPQNTGYNVRIFTLKRELPFAGHPTIGTAYIIRNEVIKDNIPSINLNLAIGQIPVTFHDDGTIWMKQNAPIFGHVHDKSEMAKVLRIDESDIHDELPVQESSTGNPHIIVPLNSLEAVKHVDVDVPRFKKLLDAAMPEFGANGICVFTPETIYPGNDFNVRVFGHLRSVPEDPATGSAIGNLAGYLVHHGYFGDTYAEVKRVEQGYEIGRPSLLLFSTGTRNNEIEIHVGGKVRMVAKGQLLTETENPR